ncbi:OmpH family outer membrane protein [Flavobacteriaceae bacterium AU392]|nr:OmpH family outer membrane protein [Flavobacteriaceae bacterium]RKM85135.1 OmpH family outer membrane protein [Flavobacteriaceae bacterium AU392]
MTKFNKLTLINSLLLIITICISLFIYFQYKNQQDLVYIDNIKLFNAFNMTKEIRSIEEAKINVAGKQIDSLYNRLQTLTDKDSSFKSLQQEITYKSKAFQELRDNYTQNLSQDVWNRLNIYIKEYAEKNNLEIILGTSGDGNVMYAQEGINITNNILEFSNQKYEGNF